MELVDNLGARSRPHKAWHNHFDEAGTVQFLSLVDAVPARKTELKLSGGEA